MMNDITVLGLGTFDGVHTGHRVLIEKITEIAKEIRAVPSVYMFTNHPLSVLSSRPPELLTTYEEKTGIMTSLGIKCIFSEKFTLKFADIEPERFFEYIIKRTNAAHIVVGFNYSFGKKGAGDPALLGKLCNSRGMGLHIIPPVKYNDIIISSTVIRQFICDAQIEKANRLLGYEYFLTGTVSEGRRVGRDIGYPTANLETPAEKALPPAGVYLTRVIGDALAAGAITNIGYRPTFGASDELSIETYIPGYLGNLYGQKIKLSLIKKMRDEKRFESIEALKAQLQKDVMLATHYFQNEKRN
ncbi:MAG TPA: bifunctional riboflavin kinase/FAD synthetase [Clostridia bacterium]|nr:bifunctional riboflavin kinase/FAD synthetase [Clostridia bacterium]